MKTHVEKQDNWQEIVFEGDLFYAFEIVVTQKFETLSGIKFNKVFFTDYHEDNYYVPR